MLVLRTFVACAFILRVGGAPLLQPPVQAATTYVQPSLDSFYDKPLGLDKLRPGDIIRERLVPTNIAGTRSVYQVLYATLDTMGRMDATVTTLYAPETPAPGPPKILSLQLPREYSPVLDPHSALLTSVCVTSQRTLLLGIARELQL